MRAVGGGVLQRVGGARHVSRKFASAFQSAKPTTKANATFSRRISPAPSCPIRSPRRSRRRVIGLSTITCDSNRRPFSVDGATVTRNSSAAAIVDVIGQMITEIWSSGNTSLWITTPGLGLPKSPGAATLTTSPRRTIIEFRHRFDPVENVLLTGTVQANHRFSNLLAYGRGAGIRNTESYFTQPVDAASRPVVAHSFRWRCRHDILQPRHIS